MIITTYCTASGKKLAKEKSFDGLPTTSPGLAWNQRKYTHEVMTPGITTKSAVENEIKDKMNVVSTMMLGMC